MSTTELESGAGAAAPVEGQTALPEQQTAGDAHQQTDAGESADQTQAEVADKGLTPEQREIKKRDRRIERLTAKRGAAEREAELLRQQLAEFQRGNRQEEGDQEQPGRVRQLTEADIERVARQRAEEITRQRDLSSKVQKVLREGAKVEGFDAAVDAVAEVIPFRDRAGRPTPFIEAVLDADNPPALLKYLGENPDEAEDLADLTPAQLGRRLAKLESTLSAKKQTSAAPAPIRPVSGASKVTPDEARMSDAEWRAKRFKRG